METFIHSVAKDLLARYGDEGLSPLQIVFPSRRAQYFFARSLASLLTRPAWEPSYGSVDALVRRFSPLKLADEYSLLIRLYRVYCRHTRSSETFDHFYFWGETLLADFDDIDRYLVDPSLLFRNLSNIKDLEGDFSFMTDEQVRYIQTFWRSFEPRRPHGLQDDFLKVWDVLLDVYLEFGQQLRASGLAYSGMLYRDMAAALEGDEDPLGDQAFVFVGFNALSECERRLFGHLQARGRADFYWDYDDYYVDQREQEAGLFLRDNLAGFPAPPSFHPPSEFRRPKDIRLLAAPSDILQAKFVHELLADTPGDLDLRTAIVLADESLLIPLLHALPPEVEEVNVTLGYPLAQTPVFTLVELLIALQRSHRAQGGRAGFYHRDVVAVLQHQYVRLLAGEAAGRLTRRIEHFNMVYVDREAFESDAFLRLVFTPVTGHRALVDYLLDVSARVAMAPAQSDEEDRALRRSYIFELTKALNRLKTSIEAEGLEIGTPVFLGLLRGVFRSMRVPFAGEPIRGLQVMGLAETRSLDFERVILLSANEGILPPVSNRPSFIPYHLRLGFKLPTPEQQEAVAAYLFYRLLQRAKRVDLLYSTKSDATRTGEMSRYLYQLKFESGHAVREQSIGYQLNFTPAEAVCVDKDAAAMDVLRSYLAGGTRSLSPSALSTYITCPLQFYFAKVARISPRDEVQEDVAANVLGTILHNALEQLYAPHLGKPLARAELEAMLADGGPIKGLVDATFAREYFKRDGLPDDFKENGRLLIARDVIVKYVRGVVRFDAAHAGFVPLGFEQRHDLEHPFSARDGAALVRLGGIIDRVDRVDGALRIIDYKTGGGLGKDRRLRFKGVESLFVSDADARNKEAFQTFLYALFYTRANPREARVVPALYFVRDCYVPGFDYHLLDASCAPPRAVTDFAQYVDAFVEQLDRVLAELFDPDVPFTQTPCAKACAFCPYAVLCGKY